MDNLPDIGQLASGIDWGNVARALLLLFSGWILARLLRRIINGPLAVHLAVHQQRLAAQLGSWLILGLFTVSALHQMGFKLGVLLGAAGVLSVAIGFASQTSASNIISGLFLLGERSFVVGDIITVDTITGEVLSVDMLSVKLRTFDNLYVRIPNEALIKGRVTNLSRFPIRRFDLKIGIAYKEDIGKAREVLLQVARDNPVCLEEPKPLVMLTGFGDSSIDIQFSIWAARENFFELRNTMQERVKQALDGAGIEIPFPHRSLYAGEATKPFPVQLVEIDRAATPPGEATQPDSASDAG